MNSVLVIGGSGMLGSHIVTLLKEKLPNVKVNVLDLNQTQDVEGVTYYQGDISIKAEVEHAVSSCKPDVIFHTASPGHGLKAPVYKKVNVDGTNIVVAVAKAQGVKALVYTSSASIVCNGTDVVNANETIPYAQNLDAYSDTKAIAELAVLQANDFSGMQTCAIRPAGLLGEGDTQLIPGLLRVSAQGQAKYQLGDNSKIFDFTYVGNCAWAHILAAQKLIAERGMDLKANEDVSRVGGEVFFITNGQPVYFWDFSRAVWAAAGVYERSIWRIPAALASLVGLISEVAAFFTGKEAAMTRYRVNFATMHRYFDIQKAEELLDYKPLVSLTEGIQRSVKWAQANTVSVADKKTQ